MTQRSRKPAAAILLATLLAGTVYVWNTHGYSGSAQGPALAELEQAIAHPDAGPDIWLRYAQRLQQAHRFDHAALAYERVLESDPYSRVGNLQCAAALARLGDVDRLYAFVSNLTRLDPRLALDVFGRPELQAFHQADRFQQLHQLAIAQSLD
ncbi:hypothetical protein HQ590_13840 [bacterium]|nr:hypothetical protein [bacterium]